MLFMAFMVNSVVNGVGFEAPSEIRCIFLKAVPNTSVVALDALNERFGVNDQLEFERGPGDTIVARIENDHAFARIALHGAQPLSFQPHGAEEVLWLSRRSYFTRGKAIRGGIPICWPWFGAHPTNPSLPAHGFARTRTWQVVAGRAMEEGATCLELRLQHDEHTRAMWPGEFDLTAIFKIGRAFEMTLRMSNTGAEPFDVSAALHAYLAVGDIREVLVHGLEDARYYDKVEAGECAATGEPVRFSSEVDRVYLETEGTCEVEDCSLGRRLRVEKRGSLSTVVWNPWWEKARSLIDVGEDQFSDFVCVETANAMSDRRTLAPAEPHLLGTTISLL